MRSSSPSGMSFALACLRHGWRRGLLALPAAALIGCSSPTVVRPTAATGGAPSAIDVKPQPSAVSTAHPLATHAALRVLAEGGNAIDATIAAQLVLGLVEPQSSGLGGGSMLLVWNPARQQLRSYDGLAAAPAHTTASLRTDVDGRLLNADAVSRGGRSVGVPGTPALLALAHQEQGRLPWAQLFQPAIELARGGHPMAPYVHAILARDPGARLHPEFRDDWFGPDGRPWPVGKLMRNPTYADTLQQLATQGTANWLRHGAAQRLADAAQRGEHPGLIRSDDVLRYRVVERDPLCATVRVWKVCSVAPPSFGGIAILQMLQMVDLQNPGGIDAAALDGTAFWHRYVEAGRLAQADRRQWVGDPDQVAVPTQAMLAPAYVHRRAALIDPSHALRAVRAGQPLSASLSSRSDDHSTVAAETSQIVVADAQGMVATTTTTINLNFGSRLRVDGYVLNNVLTNFGAAPTPGQVMANQMAPGKRPVTSMAPVIVFDAQGHALVAGGSAGGGQIVDYVARSLIEMLWLGRSPAQVLAAGHVSTAFAPRVQLEAGTARAALADGLRALGHDVVVQPLPSGAGFLQRVPGGWIGAADPRRDGVALGQ
ncbi:MAG: gamma-glutamyltransferase family protein [Rubrivivax sp.]|nr:gamma-glutamyltransferase family protein [Rubrivivax sp.]MBK8528342.1 gamma-glutamyltransferase family protein [Rubrivivax sp.]